MQKVSCMNGFHIHIHMHDFDLSVHSTPPPRAAQSTEGCLVALPLLRVDHPSSLPDLVIINHPLFLTRNSSPPWFSNYSIKRSKSLTRIKTPSLLNLLLPPNHSALFPLPLFISSLGPVIRHRTLTHTPANLTGHFLSSFPEKTP